MLFLEQCQVELSINSMEKMLLESLVKLLWKVGKNLKKITDRILEAYSGKITGPIFGRITEGNLG